MKEASNATLFLHMLLAYAKKEEEREKPCEMVAQLKHCKRFEALQTEDDQQMSGVPRAIPCSLRSMLAR